MNWSSRARSSVSCRLLGAKHAVLVESSKERIHEEAVLPPGLLGHSVLYTSASTAAFLLWIKSLARFNTATMNNLAAISTYLGIF